ncbi:MAG: BamA/TamA family outer membrane protein [Armatimonadetes bacterium]|nr:BamA/TamA family outer membrane protein [Armatimonadota bacterium]
MTLDRRLRNWAASAACVVAILAAAGVPAWAQGPTISKIDVVGNKNMSREAVVAVSGLKIGDAVSQKALDEAKRKLLLTQLYGANRVDDPEEAVRIRAELTGDAATVIIEVEENDLVKGINISGTGPVPAATIRSLMQTKEGTILNMGVLKRDADAIQAYYSDRKYQAVVGDVSLKDGILEVPVIVAKVDKVRVTGLKKTMQHVVTREMKMKPGQYFNAEEFRKDYFRIISLDFFQDVSPTIQTPTPGTIDINLNVEEKRTGNISMFVGYNSRNSLVGGAEVAETNFRGNGQSVGLRWDTGGLANRNSLELNFMEPWMDSKHTSLSVSGYDKTVYRFARDLTSTTGGVVGSNSDYYEIHTGGQVTMSRPLSDTFRGSVGLRYDNVRVPKLDISAADAAALQNGPVLATTLRATHNTRDIDQDPTSGGYEIYTLDIGRADLKPVITTTGVGTGVSGVVNYQKLQFDARRYLSPGGPRKNAKQRKSTIAIRLAGGMITGTSPFFEQYFVGGAETLRGYYEDRFWGRNMLLSSVEYRAPLASSLTGVLFMDAGDAWGGRYSGVKFQGFDQHTKFSPAVGIGLGLRVVTPIGPIRIDEGFGRNGARTHFSIGHVF